MGSLACLDGIVDGDFLLIEGDTFYEFKVLEALTETSHSDCLCIAEESGSGDEAFVEMSYEFVTKVSKDKHQMVSIAGELLGIMRLSQVTFERMLALWRDGGNRLLNYEYAFLDVTEPLGRPALFFPDLIWGDVDTEDDLRELVNYTYPKLIRKENPLDIANLCEQLSVIFERTIEPGDVRIAPIGGMSNKNFKVEYQGKAYVLRMPGPGSESMVDRICEHFNDNQASSLGLNPPIRYFDEKTGVKLADFVEGAQPLGRATIQRYQRLDQVADTLRSLHQSSVRQSNDFNVFTEIVRYRKVISENISSLRGGVREFGALDALPLLSSKLNELGVSLAACHNDLVPENFIASPDGKLYLIDWEYSGMNDPHWDLACLFLESHFSEESQSYFLSAYYKGDVPEDTPEKILIYQILMDLLWTLWTDIKELKGEDFGSYRSDRYSRALVNIELWKELYG